MRIRSQDMNWEKGYDWFLSASAWFNVLLYATPAAALLAACWFFKVSDNLWVPLLLIYLVGALAHLLGFAFMALNVQIKVSAEHTAKQIALLGATLQK